MFRCLETEFLVCPLVTLPFPQFALLHLLTCLQLRLITILGNRGCVAVASFLGVPSALDPRASPVALSNQTLDLRILFMYVPSYAVNYEVRNFIVFNKNTGTSR
jgi:hypothetical protein